MRLLDANAVAEVTCYAKSTILAYQRDGKFPKAKKSGATSRWDSDVVDVWIILAFGLKKPLPPIADEDMKEVQKCIQKLHLGSANKDLAIAQAV